MKLPAVFLSVIMACGPTSSWVHASESQHNSFTTSQEAGFLRLPTDSNVSAPRPLNDTRQIHLEDDDTQIDMEPDPAILRELITDTVQRQRSIIIPHALENAVTLSGTTYQQAAVYRVEPDGIHIRHSEGITKIPLEDMQPDWLEIYAMNPIVAREYRIRQSQRDHEARVAVHERAQLIAERERQVLHEGHLAAEQRRELREQQTLDERRRAWERYDRELSAWRWRNPGADTSSVRHTSGSSTYKTRSRVADPRPQPPPFPRP